MRRSDGNNGCCVRLDLLSPRRFGQQQQQQPLLAPSPLSSSSSSSVARRHRYASSPSGSRRRSPSPTRPFYLLDCEGANSDLARSVADVVLWRRPTTTVLALLCGTMLYYHAVFRLRSIISLIADVCLVMSCVAVSLYHLASFFAPGWTVDLNRDWEISVESANFVAAFGANLLGAVEAVFRVAASGYDYKLFLKVVTVLYLTSVIGRIISGPTLLYTCMWVGFTIPAICARLRGDDGGGGGGGGGRGGGARAMAAISSRSTPDDVS